MEQTTLILRKTFNGLSRNFVLACGTLLLSAVPNLSPAEAELLSFKCSISTSDPHMANPYEVFWVDFDKNTISTALGNDNAGPDLASVQTFPVTITPEAFYFRSNSGQDSTRIDRATGTASGAGVGGSWDAQCFKASIPFPTGKF